MRQLSNLFFKLNFWIIILIAVQIAAIIFLCLYIPSLMRVTIFVALFWLLAAISATVLFLRKGSLETKCVWFVIICALPVAGALIFFLASRRDKPHGILKIRPKTQTEESARLPYAVSYDNAQYFKTGTEFLSSALENINAAKKSVYIEFFIFSRGHVFNTLIKALETAKANGADIKIITDGVGSAFKINRKDVKRLKAAGAEVKIFHRLTPVPHARINYRDHRKILVIDGKCAYTGGVNIGDEYANISSPYGYWKDNGIVVFGKAAQVFEGMFLAMWNGIYEMDAPETGNKSCVPFFDSPPYEYFCEDAYVHAVSSAQKRVHILTPYFCVSEKTAAALSFAARRGVEIKVIIPHIPDKPYAFEVSKAFASELAKYGVEFYEFDPGFMHAKALICDNTVFLGSYNFDFRSMHFNYECGVMFNDAITDEVERDFQECLTISRKFSDKKPNFFKRLYRSFLRFFAPLI